MTLDRGAAVRRQEIGLEDVHLGREEHRRFFRRLGRRFVERPRNSTKSR
jgi:hypothetical protein